MKHPITTAIILALAGMLLQAGRTSAQTHTLPDSAARTISTLTDVEITALMKGSGSGAGRPAEINGYPGARSVVERAAELGLSPSQLARAQKINTGMHEEAMEIGMRIVDGERRLDILLRSGSTDKRQLASLVSEIAGLRGRLRLVHLQSHFDIRALLSAEQLDRFYGRGDAGGGN